MAVGLRVEAAVKAPDFAYLRPDSLEGVFAALARYGDDARILAGGQTLMALQNMRLATADVLVDINRVPGLSDVVEEQDHLVIGALVRYAGLAVSPLVREHAPLLVDAVPFIAHTAIRNRGTVGGSLALGDPAAEVPACMLALGAEFDLSSASGIRKVPAHAFYRGLYETALRSDEILTAARVPKRRPGQFHAVDEIVRRRGDFALAGLAISGEAENETVADISLAFFGVADRPVLAIDAKDLLTGQILDDGSIERARLAAFEVLDPPEDPITPPAYRRHISGVLVKRLLTKVREELI